MILLLTEWIITAGTAAKDWSREMTNEEAIQILHVSIGYEDSPEFDESLRRAIYALKKQKPMKPMKPRDRRPGYKCMLCEEMVLRPERYCQNCGQKIDWED